MSMVTAATLHPVVWARLQARRARLPHALLLTGQRGLGKLALAQAFVAGLLCEAPDDTGHACGHCLACRWRAQGNHPDFRFLQPAALAQVEAPVAPDAAADSEEKTKKASQQITIDQVRGLEEFFNVGTHRRGLRIILIHPAEAMNRNTANALLKTLEEPAADTLFVLVSHEPVRLLPTIRSRCQVVPVSVPSRQAALAWLSENGLSGADEWLALAGGAPLLAAELATEAQPSRAASPAAKGQTHKVAAGAGHWLQGLVSQLSQPAQLQGDALPDALAAAARLDTLLKEGKTQAGLPQIVLWSQKWLLDLLLAASAQAPRYFVREQATMQALARRTQAVTLLRFERQLLRWRREAEQPLNARLFLEVFFLDYFALFRR